MFDYIHLIFHFYEWLIDFVSPQLTLYFSLAFLDVKRLGSRLFPLDHHMFLDLIFGSASLIIFGAFTTFALVVIVSSVALVPPVVSVVAAISLLVLLLRVVFVCTSFTIFLIVSYGISLSSLIRSLIAATTHGPFPLDLQRFGPTVSIVRVCSLLLFLRLRLLLPVVVRLFSNFRLLPTFRRFITRCSSLWAS